MRGKKEEGRGEKWRGEERKRQWSGDEVKDGGKRDQKRREV